MKICCDSILCLKIKIKLYADLIQKKYFIYAGKIDINNFPKKKRTKKLIFWEKIILDGTF